MRSPLLPLAVVLLLLAGCASTPVHQLTQAERARYNNISSETVINDVKAKLVQARTDRLDYFAPENFADAQQALDKLTAIRPSKSNRDEVLGYAVIAQDAITAGYAAKQTARNVFSDLLALDTRLKQLNAPTLQADSYSQLAQRLKSIMDVLNKGNTAEADKEHAALKGDMEALKIKMTKQNALGQARKLVDSLQTTKAADYAPISVQHAVDSLDQADAYIQMHSDDSSGVAKAAKSALIAARHAQWISDRIKALTGTKSPPFEQVLLTEEQRLESLGKIFSVGNIQDKPLGQQTAIVANEASRLKNKASQLTGALASATSQNEQLNAQVSNCKATAGTENSQTSKLQTENTVLTQKVASLQTNIGVLKSQLQLLQNILAAKAAQTEPTPGANANLNEAAPAGRAPVQATPVTRRAQTQSPPPTMHKAAAPVRVQSPAAAATAPTQPAAAPPAKSASEPPAKATVAVPSAKSASTAAPTVSQVKAPAPQDVPATAPSSAAAQQNSAPATSGEVKNSAPAAKTGESVASATGDDVAKTQAKASATTASPPAPTAKTQVPQAGGGGK